MKPVIKKTIAITSAVVAALLVAILVLSLVIIRPIKRLGEYQSAFILTGYNQRLNRNDELLNEGIGTVKFSVMRSLLEFQAGYNIKPVMTKDEDGEDIQKKYSANSFSELHPGSGQYMIQLNYTTPTFEKKAGDLGYVAPQTNKRFTDDDGNQIRYDTVILVIFSGQNTIQDVKLYPYLKANMNNQIDLDEPDDNGIIGTEYYEIYEFTAKMYTYNLYQLLQDNGIEPGTTGSAGM